MVETYCTKTDVQLKCGTNAATLTDAQYTTLINQAESYINAIMRIDLIASYSALDDEKKKILEDAASSRAAYIALAYDQSGYTTGQVTNILNVNATLFNEAMKLLKEKYTTDFIEEN